MSPVIRISDHVYSRLEKHAQGFDTPANVIERLLNHFEGGDAPLEDVTQDNLAVHISPSTRDTTKYLFEGQKYGKNRLVLAVVKAYVTDHPDTTFRNLGEVFPRHLQGSSGVFSHNSEACQIFERTGHKRHFIEADELVSLSDCTVAVSTQWGAGNIENFLQRAASLGYTIACQ